MRRWWNPDSEQYKELNNAWNDDLKKKTLAPSARQMQYSALSVKSNQFKQLAGKYSVWSVQFWSVYPQH